MIDPPPKKIRRRRTKKGVRLPLTFISDWLNMQTTGSHVCLLPSIIYSVSVLREMKSRNWESLVEGLIHFKEHHYPDDKRIVVVCGMRDQNIHVEWIEPKETK